MDWPEDSNEKKSRENRRNILKFIQHKYPDVVRMMELEKHLGMIGEGCNRQYIPKHIRALIEEGMVEEAGGGWRLKPLGSTEGTRLLHDNKKTELAMIPISQQLMSGDCGTVWIEGRDLMGISQIELRYNNDKKSIPVNGKDSFISLWDVDLGSDKLSIWGKPFIPKSQVFIRCYVTPKLGSPVLNNL